MPTQKQQPARHVAAALLNRFDPQKQNLKDILPQYVKQTNERNILMDLVFGVIRNRELIDAIIETIGDVRVKRIQKKLINIVRIGVFELVFTPDRADYAIVDAAVEGAKKAGGSKAAGFVNALLRNINRNIKSRPAFEFNMPILPDPKDAPEKYLSMRFSLPLWLVEEWLDEFGFEKSREICIASNRRPGMYLRPNTLKATAEQLYELVRTSGVDCQLIAERGMIKINQAGDIAQLLGFDEGLFVVQDLTASEAVKTLSPQSDWKVVDLCAAPGGKTTQLAEMMGDKGTVFATDIDAHRLKNVAENCKRLGISSVKLFPFEKTADVLKNIQCDAAVLDVPCSNTGVLARRPEVRYRIKPHTLTELAKIQLQLLNRAAELIKSGGKICYSTCSIQKLENSSVVRQFLTENDGFVLSREQLLLPCAKDIDCDGGYVAILIKK